MSFSISDSLGKPQGDSLGTTEEIPVDTITVEYYENLSDVPTKIKHIIIEQSVPEKK